MMKEESPTLTKSPEWQEKSTGNWYKLVLTFTASLSSRVPNLADGPILIIHGLFAVRTTLEGNLRVVGKRLINKKGELRKYRESRGGAENFKVENKDDEEWSKFWHVINGLPGDEFYCYENDKHNYRFLHDDQEFLNRAFSLGKKYIICIENAMKKGGYVPGTINKCSTFAKFISKAVSAECDVRFGQLTYRPGKMLYEPRRIGILFEDKNWEIVDSKPHKDIVTGEEVIEKDSEMLIESFGQNRALKKVSEVLTKIIEGKTEKEERERRKRNMQKTENRNKRRALERERENRA